MKIEKNIWKKLIFLDIPLFLLGINYIFYNALALNSMKIFFRVGAIFLLFIGWILNKKFIIKKKTFLAIVLSLVALLLNKRIAFNFVVIVFFVVCVTYPIETIIRSTYKINILLIIIMVILMKLNIVNNMWYISSMGRLRYTLGFENPNVAALFYSSAVYLFIISRKKTSIIAIIISSVMTVLIYYYTNSRTSLLALMVFIILESLFLFLEKNNLKLKLLLSKCLIIMIDILFIINLLSVFMIEKFMIFDQLLSFRISSFSEMINSSSLKEFLFGGTFKTVDNFYYMLLFQYGIIIYIFIAFLIHFIMKKMVENKKFQFISLFVGLFLTGMMESSLIRPEILVILVIWKIIFSDIENNTKERK